MTLQPGRGDAGEQRELRSDISSLSVFHELKCKIHSWFPMSSPSCRFAVFVLDFAYIQLEMFMKGMSLWAYHSWIHRFCHPLLKDFVNSMVSFMFIQSCRLGGKVAEEISIFDNSPVSHFRHVRDLFSLLFFGSKISNQTNLFLVLFGDSRRV